MTPSRWRPALAATLTLSLFAAGASAQVWRGMGRLSGKVTDDAGTPIEGVLVKGYLPEAKGGTETKTNRKGEWVLGGIARGSWELDFSRAGYETRQITIAVSELQRVPPVDVKLKKVAPTIDPNEEIRQELLKAAELMKQKKFADARGIYARLLAKYPEAHQLHPLIARAYYGEGSTDKSIEHLRTALEKDPTNVEVRLLLGNVLAETGDADEGKRILASIDEQLVKDPTTFLNIGITLFNQSKLAEALTYFEKTISRFPDFPDAYYFRGVIRLQNGDPAGAKTDLTKFVAMAPSAPEAATAKKILEQLK